MEIMTPEVLPGNNERRILNFRAPPPSPVASGRRSSFENDDVLTDFLQKSIKVPELILPDRVFPRRKSVQGVPKLDFQKLESLGNESVREILGLIAILGCFEVINHGIPRDLIKLVMNSGDGIFGISPEKKRAVARSPERRYGFEENFDGEEDNEDESEEFMWCEDEAFNLEMEGIWPIGYSNFRLKMEKLSRRIEEVGGKILQFMQHNTKEQFCPRNGLILEPEHPGKIFYMKKHSRKMGDEQIENSIRYDVIKMLIRGSEFPHALCLHIWSGSNEFHVYSKKGWVSFCPNQDSIVITIGDKLQAWTDGQYKHVIGQPIFRGEDENCISIGFLYSPPKNTNPIKEENILMISISQQAIFALLLILIYQFLVLVKCL